jgi:transcription elongation factor SPT6
MDSLIDDRALEDEEDDESFDEETGEPRRSTNGGFHDSSEEEDEDDDDPEANARVREGFIVDDMDEEDEEAKAERKRRRKRRREEREDEGLDEDDLELIGMKSAAAPSSEPKFKRLKRGPREDRDGQAAGGVNDIFASDEEEEQPQYSRRGRDRDGRDEFEGFIEEDVFSDDEVQAREDEEVARPNRRGHLNLNFDDTELDPQVREDLRLAFGDGHDYDFALEKEDFDDIEAAQRDRNLGLSDVFEESQLKEKLLTEDDNVIRFADEPERHQLARRPYRHVELTEEEFKEEATWISDLMIPRRNLDDDLRAPFEECVSQVLRFLVRDDLEVPFIMNNRKDYLIHVSQKPVGRDANGNTQYESHPDRLLEQKDLWDIYEFDLKFRALIEKRRKLSKTYEELKSSNVPPDSMFEELLPLAATMEELQDLQDYLYFQYASQIKDLALTNGETTNGTTMSRKTAATRTSHEVVRASKAYGMVRAFGITATQFAQNVARIGVKTFAEDPADGPEDTADGLIDEEFSNGTAVLKAGKSMFVEELVQNPRFRKVVRTEVYRDGVVDCHRTEKGLRRIDEQHAYYEFKYLRNQSFRSIASNPETYLKMLKAEEEGLIEVKVRLENHDSYRRQLLSFIESDNFSSIADAWNRERKAVVSAALDKIMVIMGKLAKENLRTQCETEVSNECRDKLRQRLDQAPFQPRGMKKGTTPRVLTLTNGRGIPGKDPTYWAFIGDDGRVAESGKFLDLAPGDRERGLPDGKDVDAFRDLIHRREPEVIGISGFTPDTRKLYKHIHDLIENHDIRGAAYNDDEDDRDRRDPLDVLIVNDEVARLYMNSDKAKAEHPGYHQLTHYCVALGRYLRNPIQEYASLGKNIISISFDPAQYLLPQDKLLKKLEMALVDIVNMIGVDINEATSDAAIASLLPYVSGLGERKAGQVIKVINMIGGSINKREDLLGIGKSHAATEMKVWSNAASFLLVEYDQAEPDAEYLDSTRIHPEDYDIARKMAADALELDEEDIEAERAEFGSGAIVRRLVKEEATDRVNDLVLEEYAEQLEKNLNAKKRSTLENIRAELIEPFEELRRDYDDRLEEGVIFTMFTGETDETLQVGMNVPVRLIRVTDDSMQGILDCGLEATIMADSWLDDRGGQTVSPKQIWAVHQTVQGHITRINRKEFRVDISLRDEQVKRPFRRFDPTTLGHNEWDDREEAADNKVLEQKAESGARANRVIKHPLFRAFNAKQAEEYLGSQNRGDVVIRPSSKGTDHLAVTWKVADGIFQHIDVLELDKENEFALGRKLLIQSNSQKYEYTDLDELIVSHIKGMARKVDEMFAHEKFQDKTKSDLGKPSSHLPDPCPCPSPALPTSPPTIPAVTNIPRRMARNILVRKPQGLGLPILPQPR